MTNVWLPQFACPECREIVRNDGVSRFVCRTCVYQFEYRGGIYRFLAADRAARVAPFLRQYRLVREGEGYRAGSPEYYRMLPSVPSHDRHAAEWRVRRESYLHLQKYALPAIWRGPIRVLDLGAGNGWLSHRIASFGHHVIAVDQQDDEADGLGVCRHYPVSFVAVQADYDALPFAPGQFDLAVFEGSLHYSPDPHATLEEAWRMLAPGGAIAVMDSPMFEREHDGRAMIADQNRQLELEHGVTNVVRPGVGFLTFAGLDRIASTLGLRARFYWSHGPLPWRVRRQLARLKLRRRPAAFGVWVAVQEAGRLKQEREDGQYQTAATAARDGETWTTDRQASVGRSGAAGR